jgi:hypothetical protein
VIVGVHANSWHVCFAVLPVGIVVSFVAEFELQLRKLSLVLMFSVYLSSAASIALQALLGFACTWSFCFPVVVNSCTCDVLTRAEETLFFVGHFALMLHCASPAG